MYKNKTIWLKCLDRIMYPIIIPNDMLYLKYVTFRNLKVNDIVVYNIGNRLLQQRVIYASNYVVLQGDNNITTYKINNGNNIIGKILKIKRNNIVYSPEDFYTFQSSLYFREITKIKIRLKKAGIDPIFLKGLIPYLYYFKNIPHRIYADCDILIKKEKYFLIKKILLRLGYREILENKYAKMHKLLRSIPTEFIFTKELSNIIINLDIHLEVIYLMTQNGIFGELYSQKLLDNLSEKFQKEKQQIKIFDETFFILSPENMIIYLSLHFYQHNFKGVHRLELLGKLIKTKRNSINWVAIADTINMFKINNFVFPVLLILRKLYSVSIPDQYLDKIKPNKNILKYINKNVMSSNSFTEEDMYTTKTIHIKNMYNLSPSKFMNKIFFLLNPNILYFTISIIIGKLKKYELSYDGR